jgi:hypothetical protein
MLVITYLFNFQFLQNIERSYFSKSPQIYTT